MSNVPRTPRERTLDDIVIDHLEGDRTLVDIDELSTNLFLRVELEPPIPRPTRMPRATPPVPVPMPMPIKPRIPDVVTAPYQTVDFGPNILEAQMVAARAHTRDDVEIPPWRDSSFGRVVLAIALAGAAIGALVLAAAFA